MNKIRKVLDNAKVEHEGRMFYIDGEIVKAEKKKITLASLFPKKDKK